ncbi:unnamed protein product [Microthlaspi erraticum]|uniref:MATH domain-containing protein n=1 Tax=Microthlaspi erraticum TaxID=1685480 RepID=A0A6D2KZ14_9BRAS|nr:unnamed protein product [Microthlaspi erraticum]
MRWVRFWRMLNNVRHQLDTVKSDQKTTYTNLLHNLIKLLNKPPHSFTETDLSNAHSELIDLTEAGFELDWLKTKLADISLESKKSNSDGSRVQELEKHIKNLKVELEKEITESAAKVLSLEQRVSNLENELNKKKAKSASPKAFSFKDVVCLWDSDTKEKELPRPYQLIRLERYFSENIRLHDIVKFLRTLLLTPTPSKL